MNPQSSHIPSALDQEIAAYAVMKEELQNSSLGKWVVFCRGTRQGTYKDFETAASFAITNFGRGPYLIRQIGEGELALPASVLYASYRDAG